MKNFLTFAKSRKTTYEFSNKQVKGSDIQKILEAARWAPSCSNIQPWHFVIVKNKGRIKKLMQIASYGAFHTNPTLIIALILKKECWSEEKHLCVREGKLGIYESFICIAMPALNMVYEAQELGINSCFLSPEPKKVSEILKVRTGDSAPLMVGFGYERKGAFQKKRERKELEELVFYEYFGGKRDKE